MRIEERARNGAVPAQKEAKEEMNFSDELKRRLAGRSAVPPGGSHAVPGHPNGRNTHEDSASNASERQSWKLL